MAEIDDYDAEPVMCERPACGSDANGDTTVVVADANTSVRSALRSGARLGQEDEKLILDILSEITCCFEAQLRLLPKMQAVRHELAKRRKVPGAAANVASSIGSGTTVFNADGDNLFCVVPGDDSEGDDSVGASVCGVLQSSGSVDVGAIDGYLASQKARTSKGHDETKCLADVGAHGTLTLCNPNRESDTRASLSKRGQASAEVANSSHQEVAPVSPNRLKPKIETCSSGLSSPGLQLSGSQSSRASRRATAQQPSQQVTIELWPMFLASNKIDTVPFGGELPDINMQSEDARYFLNAKVGVVYKSENPFLQYIPILHPNSRLRVVIDVLTMIVVIYEMVTIPMGSFEEVTVDKSVFVRRVSALTTIFWLFELFTQFCFGFWTDEDAIEMRICNIAKRYTRSGWFYVDVLLVLIDLLLFMMYQKYSYIVRMARFTRVARIFRLLKVARFMHVSRLFKLKKILGEVSDLVSSNVVFTGLRILEGIVKIVLFCHIIGCAWYALGKNNVFTGSSLTWIEELRQKREFDNDTWVYWYLVCIYFAFSIFTPAAPPLGISPVNLPEQLFMVISFLTGVVVFTTFASSVTSTIVLLKSQKMTNAKQELLLRQFISDHGVSSILASRILRCIRERSSSGRVITLEADLHILHDLPKDIIRSLRFEVYHRAIVLHPFFRHFRADHLALLRHLSQNGVTQRVYRKGDLVFKDREPATHMMFIYPAHTPGSHRIVLRFDGQRIKEDRISESFDSTIARERFVPDCQRFLHEEEWFGETALWLADNAGEAIRGAFRPWRREGYVECLQRCCLSLLCGTEFRRVVSMDEDLLRLCRGYAREFKQLLDSIAGSRDIWRDSTVSEQLIANAQSEVLLSPTRWEALRLWVSNCVHRG
eukprot:TRINITY_DN56046_c0_g1_i1.p1 TRINITY_DN56046_c0_g1~~TRINITY_DN56046_c0_g1_i1.p1  ORF type:complete len:912 (+),score=104.57 TRINITY_DN56046_c0_g1_i1:92-2737(+)